MRTVTLTTDFGTNDGNVGVMKGVILGIAPDVQIVDLSHQIAPQNIGEGALILARSTLYFPADSVHIAVVDPGVGTDRRPIAGRIGDQFFVGPDNGIFTLLIERAGKNNLSMEWVHLNQPRFWLSSISHVFHGRDIFAPSGAHLANGVALDELGTPILNLVQVALPKPVPTPTGMQGEVIHIDHFGNISTSIRREHLDTSNVITHIAGLEINGMVNTFGEAEPGELIVLFGSTDSLLVCKVNGNAAAQLGVNIGDPINLILK